MEWRVPLFSPEAGADSDPRKNLSLALFADIGQSWDHNTGPPSDDREGISSAGLELIWRPGARFSADFYYGHDINSAPGTGSDLQDKGWHFNLELRFPSAPCRKSARRGQGDFGNRRRLPGEGR